MGSLVVSIASTDPTITLDVTSGPPGTAIKITGTGFPAGELVGIYIDSGAFMIGQPGPLAEANGNVQYSFPWPDTGSGNGVVDPSKPGPHQVCGDTAYPGSTQPIAAKACATFMVEAGPPSPTPTPSLTPAPPPASPSLPVPAVLAAFVVLAALVGGVLWLTRKSPNEPPS